MRKEQPESFVYLKELIEAAEDAVVGYENYLLEKINSQQLAKIMKRLSVVLDDRFDWADDDK